MSLINLTPHDITLAGKKGDLTFHSHPDCSLARASTLGPRNPRVNRHGIPVVDPPTFCVTDHTRQSIQSLVEEEGAAGIIVSQIFAEHLIADSHLIDFEVYSPDTGPDSVIRDEKGNIVAV